MENKFKRFILWFSLQEREKREFHRFQKELECLNLLSDDEIISIDINLKSKYGRSKNIFTFLIVTVLLSLLGSVTAFFFSIGNAILKIYIGKPQEAKIILILMIILYLVFLISIMLVLLANIKTMYDYKKRIYIVEEVRKKRNV